MKGIILAGGNASRLKPSTNILSKHLLPVYDKPLIYFPLTTLMLMGINEITIVTNPRDLEAYKMLFHDFDELGVDINFAVQSAPRGLPDAFVIAEKYIKNKSVCLILGDNIFHGSGLGRNLCDTYNNDGALITSYQVSDPRAFGVVNFTENGEIESLIEKPANPKSNWAVPGIYFYDKEVPDLVKSLKPSERGELEIMDLNNLYLSNAKLSVKKIERGTTWLDAGTPNSLLEAATYVKVVQERQGLLIGSPEEAAWRMGWINDEKLIGIGTSMSSSEYGNKLKNLVLDSK